MKIHPKLLTIIIPTFNSSRYLIPCLNSIEKQTFKNYDVFIADGGSKDNTLEIFKKYLFSHKVVSKKDKACGDGINKALLKIKSKYFMIIGSDDIIGDQNYIKNLVKNMSDCECDIILPQLGIIKNNIKKKIYQSNDFKSLIYKTVTPEFGWIAKTKIFEKKKFNFKEFKIANHYEMFLKLYLNKKIFLRSEKPIYYFRLGGNSYKDYIKALNEQRIIALRAKGPIFKIYFEFSVSLLKFFIKYKVLKFILKDRLT
ncbi:glycosyltransferase [Candidatus Pelagibacter ubique]|nr:glycosyltransferase [Candidatus Pelagibacter ubique]